ncbi:MAG: DUF2339 domain-containing protein [candidate division KSB1 bacterium]|nr:DUF2339 domain-containing protein [candidate division KSB1 bacterium]MDZ7273912.1 DUF2339 domain-containing protein [candidate division KSB1 bacterium]MDZ7286068.1 DUF2339 domain-containing protein [candidate division KSB1 bacterium]MDZ7299100.1 DUF2339 domain-containing protein [candidate division KSB1 bacterium]MDZ7306403.1 DUF2339 domain-containing protein [candidate division KSB1 bacterium]
MSEFLLLLLIILMVVYIRKTNRLSEAVQLLQFELRVLKAGQAAAPAPSEPRVVTPTAAPSPVPIVPAWPDVPATATPAAAAPSATAPPPPPAQPPKPPVKPSRTRAEWEALVGGKLLNRIGALALILGVGFFLKYAFDNNWLSETMRVLIGAAIGAGLLLAGRRSQQRDFRIFAQGLIGAGIAILYLSAYASCNFYQLVPQEGALLLMAGVTALAIWQALTYDALAISVLGWAGGFLTPFMLNLDFAQPVQLFIYLALLTAGLLAVAYRKDKWAILEPLTLGGSYLIYVAWYAEAYTSRDFPRTIVFLTVLWGMFLGLEVLRGMRSVAGDRRLRHLVAVLNAAFFFICLYSLMEQEHGRWTGSAAFAISLVYFMVMLGLQRRNPAATQAATRLTLTAIVLLALATAIEFSGFDLIMLWAVEALALLAAGAHWRRHYVWQAALFLLAVTTVGLLFFTTGALDYKPLSNFTPVLNPRFLAFLVLAGVCFAGAYIFKGVAHQRSELVRTALHYGWCALAFILVTVETVDTFARLMQDAGGTRAAYFGSMRDFMLTVVWAALAVPLVLAGLRHGLAALLYCGLAALGLALLLGVLQTLQPFEEFVTLLNHRFLSVVAVLAATLFLMRELSRQQHSRVWIKRVLIGLTVAAVLLFFEVLTVETNDTFARLAGAAAEPARARLRHLQPFVLALVWLAYSLPLLWYGLRRQALPVICSGLVGLALALATGLLHTLSAFAPLADFVAGLNYRVAAVALLAAGACVQERWLKQHEREQAWFRWLLLGIPVVAVLLIFELITAEARDYFDRAILLLKQASAGAEPSARIDQLRNLQQLSISSLWLLYSILLMAFGIWRRQQGVRLLAIGLFGITILKIFFYDLSFLDTLYRIFAFMGLGLILLLVSYLYQRYKAIIFEAPAGSKAGDKPAAGSS